MFDEERWAEVPAIIDQIEALTAVKPGASVLDSCCGTGRHSLELAARGYKVTGVDLSAGYLEAARASAEGLPGLQFMQADIREFESPENFDLALNLFTSFGYFADPNDDVLALRNIRKSLKPGGSFILETQGKETTVRDFVRGESFERAGLRVTTEYSVAGAWEGLKERWILKRDGRQIADRSFVLRLYSGLEMKQVLYKAGFREVRIFGDLGGSAYDQEAKTLAALAIA